MAISTRTIKRLFALSQNECANPNCPSALVVGESNLGEICHIRARRKGGPRYDASLTAKERDSEKNLLILCSTCHTLVDNDETRYTPELLTDFKTMHERGIVPEITPRSAAQAELILEAHFAKNRRTKNVNQSNIHIEGDNSGNISVNQSNDSSKGKRGYSKNSIGADANLKGYIDYLCDLYVKYMQPIEQNEQSLRGRLGRQIKDRFRLRSRTRNDLPAARFYDLVEYLLDRLSKTPVGKKHLSRGTKFYSSFEEWRTK